MDCTEVKALLLARRRGELDADQSAALDAHLVTCAGCQRDDAADRELSIALETRLPRRSAPASLRRSLEARWAPGGASTAPAVRRPRARWAAAGMAATFVLGAALALAVALVVRTDGAGSMLLREAVNDHLRVLYSLRPVEVESADMHHVKPWFEGRLDFAPTAFAGDDEFPLQGALVGYFVDRKAAVFVYRRRLHMVTLSVMRAEGLPWGAGASGLAAARPETRNGFHALLWRKGDLGYVVVSDMNEGDLHAIAEKIDAAAGPG